DFDFDPPITGVHLGRDLFQELFDGWLNTDRHPAVDALVYPAQQPPERSVLELCLEVPQRSFEARLRHSVAANTANKIRECRQVRQILSERSGNNVVAQDVPGGFPCFGAVERAFGSSNFAPACLRAIRYRYENDVPVLCRPE